MTIQLQTVAVRHERRVRLSFSVNLAGGAFASVAFYSVSCLDGSAAIPGVVAALVVSNSPNVVELQLDADLAQGALYRFFAEAVPAVDATTTPAGSALDTRVNQETRSAAAGTHGAATAMEKLLYGEDLLFSGDDFAEDWRGDLATIAGIPCVLEDLQRLGEIDALPWDPSFGLQLRQFVDGSPFALPEARGRVIAAYLKDDRVKSCNATVDTTSDPPVIDATPVLIGAGGANVEPIRLTFPVT